MNLRAEITARAFEIGALLNLVADEEQRELLREHIDYVIADELAAGEKHRKLAAAMVAGHSIRVSLLEANGSGAN